jgi:hypothetical protein
MGSPLFFTWSFWRTVAQVREAAVLLKAAVLVAEFPITADALAAYLAGFTRLWHKITSAM